MANVEPRTVTRSRAAIRIFEEPLLLKAEYLTPGRLITIATRDQGSLALFNYVYQAP